MCGRRAPSTSSSSREKPGEQRWWGSPSKREPRAEASVSCKRPAAVTHVCLAGHLALCRLKGSELLQQLKLDERFVLYFHTKLTWHSPAAHPGDGGSNGNGNGSSNGSSSSKRAAGAAGQQGSISAEADVQVWSEVVGPFQAIPRGILQVGMGGWLFMGGSCSGPFVQDLPPPLLLLLRLLILLLLGMPGWRSVAAVAPELEGCLLPLDSGPAALLVPAHLPAAQLGPPRKCPNASACPIPLFPLLQGTGNAVMGALMNALLPVFLRK